MADRGLSFEERERKTVCVWNADVRFLNPSLRRRCTTASPSCTFPRAVFELLGLAGIAISVAAYVPQIIHLEREHCSEGVSSRAWWMWIAGGLLIGALAVHHRDPVFIALQVSSLTSAAVILFLAWRYRGMACESHTRRDGRRQSVHTLHERVARPASPTGVRHQAPRVA
jgi:lipid-A-disaccharide synthase-like uncharacterized protein